MVFLFFPHYFSQNIYYIYIQKKYKGVRAGDSGKDVQLL